jgi:hypothetical protein
MVAGRLRRYHQSFGDPLFDTAFVRAGVLDFPNGWR